MVTRNEADRYLDASLAWHLPAFDGFHVYDDQSTDDTVAVAKNWGAEVTIRTNDSPAFLEHEGLFRQAAWDAAAQKLRPETGDWVFSIDADEFVTMADTAGYEAPGNRLIAMCNEAKSRASRAIVIRVPEVFEVVANGAMLEQPKVRTDGYWAMIRGCRLFAYQPNGRFLRKAMASGSEPTFVQAPFHHPSVAINLLHYGYAQAHDRQAKYARYSAMTHLHSGSHITSILEPPALADWDGPCPQVWTGVRIGGH
jgi:Glycosyl transferase family 2